VSGLLPPGPVRVEAPSEPAPFVVPDFAARGRAVLEEYVRTGVIPFTADGLVVFYNLMMADRGFNFPPHLFPVAMALMDDRIPKLMIIVGPGSGKSSLLSTVYPAFRLGHDPTMTIVGVSAGEALVQGFMAAVMEWVEKSKTWARLFPHVRPDKDLGWSTEAGMFVTGRAPGDPDSSYAAFGLTSTKLTGVHARLIICDDIHNEENSSSASACEGVRSKYYRTVLGRADPRGARFIIAGRRWHEEDLYGHLAKSEDWVVMSLPAERVGEKQLYWTVEVPDGLVCCFTEGRKS
jgi:hypothetical protein